MNESPLSGSFFEGLSSKTEANARRKFDQTKLNQYIHGLKTYFPGGDKTALALMMVADQGFHYSRTWSDVRDQFQQLFSEDNFPRDVKLGRSLFQLFLRYYVTLRYLEIPIKRINSSSSRRSSPKYGEYNVYL